MKKAFSVIFSLIVIVTAFSACSSKDATSAVKPMTESSCAIIHEPEFGGVYIKMTIDDFNALGFKYGDSVRVEFSNGYTLSDVPYYNGYYTANGEPLVVAYPGYDYIKACINNGDDLWEIAKLNESDTAYIAVNTPEKYADIQKARDIHYTDNRDDYASDEVFANFRSVSVSAMKENTLYRSASPCDNQHNRAAYVDTLIKNAGVNYILNPTFGYILSFIPGAYLAGYIREKFGAKFLTCTFAGILAIILIYAVGIPYYYLVARFYLNNVIAAKTILTVFILMPLPGDIISCVIAGLLVQKLNKFIRL